MFRYYRSIDYCLPISLNKYPFIFLLLCIIGKLKRLFDTLSAILHQRSPPTIKQKKKVADRDFCCCKINETSCRPDFFRFTDYFIFKILSSFFLTSFSLYLLVIFAHRFCVKFFRQLGINVRQKEF